MKTSETIELTRDDIQSALELLCDDRGLGDLAGFEVVSAPEPTIRVHVEVMERGPVTPPTPFKGWTRDQLAGIRAMEIATTWIPVTPDHPKVGETVLIWRDGEAPSVATRDAYGWTGAAGPLPTHWIKIPILDPWDRPDAAEALGYSEADVAEADAAGLTLDRWGRYCLPGEWRLPPGMCDSDSGTRGVNAAGMTEAQVGALFALAARLDAVWRSHAGRGQ